MAVLVKAAVKPVVSLVVVQDQAPDGAWAEAAVKVFVAALKTARVKVLVEDLETVLENDLEIALAMVMVGLDDTVSQMLERDLKDSAARITDLE